MARINPFAAPAAAVANIKDPYLYRGAMLYYSPLYQPFNWNSHYACVAQQANSLACYGHCTINLAVHNHEDVRAVMCAAQLLSEFFESVLGNSRKKIAISTGKVRDGLCAPHMHDVYELSTDILGKVNKAPRDSKHGYVSFEIQIHTDGEDGVCEPSRIDLSLAKFICKSVRQLIIFSAFMPWMTDNCALEKPELFMRRFFRLYNWLYPEANHAGHWIEQSFSECFLSDKMVDLCKKIHFAVEREKYQSGSMLSEVEGIQL